MIGLASLNTQLYNSCLLRFGSKWILVNNIQMRASTLLVLVLFSSVLITETQQFSFPRLDFLKFKDKLKKEGQRFINKLSFVKWIVETLTNRNITEKNITSLIHNVTEKYFHNNNLKEISTEDIERHEEGFSSMLRADINAFQDYLINLYGIDKTDTEFINHIKSYPDKFFLNFETYNLLRGVNLAELLSTNTPKATDSVKQKIAGSLHEFEL